jgi:hypothetical protein
LSDVERVRAASIRALRYSIHRITIFEKFLENRLDYLICRYDCFFTPSKKLSSSPLIRSLAIELRNARERLEAYKFIRRFIHLYPQKIPHSFVYVLDSIVSSSYLSHLNRPMNSSVIIRSDQMIKCSLELLCEIGKKSFLIFHFSMK